MKATEVIATHTNTDFDAFAAMLAARLLYPNAVVSVSGALNRNVREFYRLHADELDAVETSRLETDAIRRLIVVETTGASRLGELEEVALDPDVEKVLFDHHAGELPEWVKPENAVISQDGALTTTQRDADALAWCLRHGARQELLASFLHTPLGDDERELLGTLMESLESDRVAGVEVLIAAVSWPRHVDGVSNLAHKIADLTDTRALVLLVEMGDRVFCVTRSRTPAVDAAAIARALGGGGHREAPSAMFRGTLDEAR